MEITYTFSQPYRLKLLTDGCSYFVSDCDAYLFENSIFYEVAQSIDGTQTDADIALSLQNSWPMTQSILALHILQDKGIIQQKILFPQEVDEITFDSVYSLSDNTCLTNITCIPTDTFAPLVQSVSRLCCDSIHLFCTEDYLDQDLWSSLNANMAVDTLLVKPVGERLLFGPLFTKKDGFEYFDRFRNNCILARSTEWALIHKYGRQWEPIERTIDKSGLEGFFQGCLTIIESNGFSSNHPVSDSYFFSYAINKGVWKKHSVNRVRSFIASDPSNRRGKVILGLKQNIEKQSSSFGGYRVRKFEETIASLYPFFCPINGIITSLKHRNLGNDLHAYTALVAKRLVNSRIQAATAQNIRQDCLLYAAGKGKSKEQALASCLAEAIERYCYYFSESEKVIWGSRAAIGSSALELETILNFSDLQYDNRERFNRTVEAVPTRLPEDMSIEWVEFYKLFDEEIKLVPKNYCYYNEDISLKPTYCYADSNGCASGNSVDEAILQAILELIERDACAIWWYNEIARPDIDIDSLNDPSLHLLKEHLTLQGREFYILDITHDLGIPVFVAVSYLPRKRSSLQFGAGCHIDPQIAVTRAASELYQVSQISFSNRSSLETVFQDKKHNDNILIPSYLKPINSIQLDLKSNFNAPVSKCISDDISYLVEKLKRKNLSVFVRELTHPDINFPVVRVIIPRLRHFWRRVGPGRLYEVPVSLGWLPEPKKEWDLNTETIDL